MLLQLLKPSSEVWMSLWKGYFTEVQVPGLTAETTGWDQMDGITDESRAGIHCPFPGFALGLDRAWPGLALLWDRWGTAAPQSGAALPVTAQLAAHCRCLWCVGILPLFLEL